MTSIPGIGKVYSAGIIAEIGDIHRFDSQASVAKYAGLVWNRSQSGDFEAEHSRMIKSGNRYLRYYLLEAANSVRRCDSEFRRYYDLKFKEVNKYQHIQMIDSRPLSDKQRRTCYKLIREISNYTGMGLDPTKEYMKLKFIAEDLQETADQMFSLSNAPMSLVCAFQRFLVRFILDWDIPCSFSLLDFVDDVQDYLEEGLR